MENIDSTVSASLSAPSKTINYKFGEYNIVVRLSSSNEFLGIEEIGIDKSFYDYKTIGKGHDAREFYEQ